MSGPVPAGRAEGMKDRPQRLRGAAQPALDEHHETYEQSHDSEKNAQRHEGKARDCNGDPVQPVISRPLSRPDVFEVGVRPEAVTNEHLLSS